MPDLLTVVANMAAHGQGFEGCSGRLPHHHSNKYGTCFKEKVSGYSDKPRCDKMIVTLCMRPQSESVGYECDLLCNLLCLYT